MKELRKLAISGANVGDLPDGLYLSRLESLCMRDCYLYTELPPTLAAATQLRNLEMQYIEGLQLTAADRSLLTALPALETISLHKPYAVSQLRWDVDLMQLQSEFAAQGRYLPNIRIKVSEELVRYIMCQSFIDVCVRMYQTIERWFENVCLYCDG